MLIGVTVTIVSGLIGITIGVLGGFFGGRIDDAVLFAITTRLSIPVVLVALAVVGLLGTSMTLLVLTLGLLLWDRFAVVARSTSMQVRNLDFVAAAWCAGCSRFRVLSREVLPNIASHLVVVATLEVALAILLEATLSFLGLGVPPPLPSWGLMIAEAKDYMFFSPWVIVIPGVALFVLVLGINLLGDGLRDAFGTRSAHMSALLEVERLASTFGGRTAAVRGASLTVERGETHCLVGESGCGKSVTALAIMNLLARGGRRTAQRLRFQGEETC
jgi:peptide/nickel transport system permease protein